MTKTTKQKNLDAKLEQVIKDYLALKEKLIEQNKKLRELSQIIKEHDIDVVIDRERVYTYTVSTLKMKGLKTILSDTRFNKSDLMEMNLLTTSEIKYLKTTIVKK